MHFGGFGLKHHRNSPRRSPARVILAGRDEQKKREIGNSHLSGQHLVRPFCALIFLFGPPAFGVHLSGPHRLQASTPQGPFFCRFFFRWLSGAEFLHFCSAHFVVISCSGCCVKRQLLQRCGRRRSSSGGRIGPRRVWRRAVGPTDHCQSNAWKTDFSKDF